MLKALWKSLCRHYLADLVRDWFEHDGHKLKSALVGYHFPPELADLAVAQAKSWAIAQALKI